MNSVTDSIILFVLSIMNKISVITNKTIILICFAACCFYSCNKSEPDYADVAPIIYKHCSNCHRPGQSGPFDLLNYNDCKKHAATIKFVTEARTMPPWPADADYVHFADENYLSTDEIDLIGRWIENGCEKGDEKKFPAVPQFVAGSELGKPDLILKVPPYLIKGENREKFIMMKVPFELPSDTFLKAVEFVAGNKKLLHHMNGHLLVFDDKKQNNIFEGPFQVDRDTAYYISESAHELNLLQNDGSVPEFYGSVANYLPGTSTTVYPDGIGGAKLKKYNVLLLRDVHYGATPVDEWDSSFINIFFTDKSPGRITIEKQMGTLGISKIVPPLIIPPNKISTFRTQSTLPVTISLLTINPHMHLLGKSFWAYAIKPDGDTIRIVRIPKWDFRWQYFYTYQKPLIIPEGSTIYVEGVYDNTDSNPNNPFYPPQIVREPIGGNMKTTDEMFQLIMTFLPYQPGDEKIDLTDNAVMKR